MKYFFLLVVLLHFFSASAQKKSFVEFGIDYRQYPIDIEDVRGGGQTGGGLMLPSDKDERFWQTFSLSGKWGLLAKKNWLFSFSTSTRYNYLHRTQNHNTYYNGQYNVTTKTRNAKFNFKYDLFFNIEKKIKLNKQSFILAEAGVGFTNINSKFDVTLTDSLEHQAMLPVRYHGTLRQFGPKFSLGYQYKKFKAMITAFVIEDPDLNNLTSLWIGGGLSYEMLLKKRKKGADK